MQVLAVHGHASYTNLTQLDEKDIRPQTVLEYLQTISRH